MAFTSAKMGLRVWNLLTDLYDHAQLADNWARLDYHDHSPGKGVQIPTDGLADGAVTAAKLATVTDPSGAYLSLKPIIQMRASATGSQPAGTFCLNNIAGAIAVVGSADSMIRSGFYLDPADWVSPGRTPRLVLRAHVITNNVAPTASYTFTLFPVATYGGTNLAPTIATTGTAVSGSTTPTIATPAAGGPSAAVSAEFDSPATAGWYTICVTQTGASVANAYVAMLTTLFARQV